MFGRYRAHLEAELVKQELMLKFVINDKEKTIQELREELRYWRSRSERLELALTPAPRLELRKAPLKAKEMTAEGETSWNAYLNNYIKSEEERIAKEKHVHGQNGQGLHEPASSDALRPDGGNAAAETATATKPA